MRFCADFETTTDKNDCRVWATGICTIDENKKFYYENNIDFFFRFAQLTPNSTFYFHNLKFDGEFICIWLYEHGYKYTTKQKLEPNEFNTLISDTGLFYSIKIRFTEENITTILDSLKILPFSVDEIAKGFDLENQKLDLDYDTYRPVGHKLTEHEIVYLQHDVFIVAEALLILFKQKLKKMTQGSNALEDFKKIYGKDRFKNDFPIPYYDADVRQSYKGGYTYCNKKFQGLDIEDGLVLDVNSLYPWVMYYCKLPYGEGIEFKGKYQQDDIYNLYVQKIRCNFKLKNGYLPTIQIKQTHSIFQPTEYLLDDEGEYVSLCLTCVDLEIFLEHYEVTNIEYCGGWKFKSTTDTFKAYIDKWYKIKEQATKDGNMPLRQLAKLMLNALYGKFGLNPNVRSKHPYLEDGVLKYRYGPKETRDPLYIPLATFITAWARHKTITAAQSCYDRFLYADTDSLHLIGTELPKQLEIDNLKLGAWKLETRFKRARFLRQKCYIEETLITEQEKSKILEDAPEKSKLFYYINGELRHLNVTCAGMPKNVHKDVTWDNFQLGQTYNGKLTPTHVKGGIVLEETTFTIKK